MKIFKAVILLFGILAAAVCLVSCSDGERMDGSDVDNKSAPSFESISEESDENDEENNDITTVSSSLSSPLSVEEWGVCAKYCTSTEEYVNVPVRLTGIIKGKDAQDRIKSYARGNDSFIYRSPEKGTEWVIAQYELSLTGFPVDKGGADCIVTSFAVSSEGDMLTLNGKGYIPTTINITPEKYSYEGIVQGEIAYCAVKDGEDYILTIGEYGETQAYFLIKKDT